MNYLKSVEKIFFCALVIFGVANLHSVPPGSVFKPRTTFIQPYKSPLVKYDSVPSRSPYVDYGPYQPAITRYYGDKAVRFDDASKDIPLLEDEDPDDLLDDADYRSDLELGQTIRIKISEIEREYSAQGFKYLLKNADTLLAEIGKMSKSSQLHLLFLLLVTFYFDV